MWTMLGVTLRNIKSKIRHYKPVNIKKFQCLSELGYFEEVVKRLEQILDQKNNNENSMINR